MRGGGKRDRGQREGWREQEAGRAGTHLASELAHPAVGRRHNTELETQPRRRERGEDGAIARRRLVDVEQRLLQPQLRVRRLPLQLFDEPQRGEQGAA